MSEFKGTPGPWFKEMGIRGVGPRGGEDDQSCGMVIPVSESWASTGMSYRQWLAGLAMQAFISRLDGQPYGTEEMKFVAEYSIKQADALIAQEAKIDNSTNR